jgi:hypothetical protein
MKLHPFYDVVDNAIGNVHLKQGGTVFQQWLCHHCGVKQTMGLENQFYKKGKCEECGEITDIEQDGCNFMALFTSKAGSKQT